jgi:hypothetical protein
MIKTPVVEFCLRHLQCPANLLGDMPNAPVAIALILISLAVSFFLVFSLLCAVITRFCSLLYYILPMIEPAVFASSCHSEICTCLIDAM